MPNQPIATLPISLYNTGQARVLDRIAIEEQGIAGFELMSRAAAAVLAHIRRCWPEASQLTIFCGAGNNGGDGYLLASLALQQGLFVRVFSVCELGQLHGDAALAREHYLHSGGTITAFDSSLDIAADVLVDALLGIGLARPVTGLMAEAIHAINNHPAATVAVDVPSGLNANTGNIMGIAVQADMTVTFISLKQGLFTGQAADVCGEIIFASLAVPNAVYQAVPTSTFRIIPQPLPRRSRCSHKGHFGHVLIIGGNKGFCGAALLAGTAALRAGAGLVSIASHPEHSAFLSLHRPELMCHGINHAEQLQTLLDKATVIVIGPGLGQDAWAKQLLVNTLASDKPLVIDADALNLLAAQPCQKDNWILTPHPGEAGRLLACSTADIQQDRFAAVANLQKKYHGVCLLKGSGSLIASPDSISVSTTGNPGMASGGMGDALCGIIAALLAQGLPLAEAAQQGAYCHGKAADMAAAAKGERGLLASDLLPFLRQWVN